MSTYVSIKIVDDKDFGVDASDPSIYRCRSGLVLRLKPVGSLLIRQRSLAIPTPEPPMVTTDSGREEPHYGAPSYIRALQDYDEEVAKVNMGTYFLLGTEVLERPDDIPDVDDESWSRRLEDPETWGDQAMSIPRVGSDARYIFWITNIALRDIEIAEIGAQIRVLSGALSEAVVKEAMASFRNIDNTGSNSTGRVEPTKLNRAQRRTNNRANRTGTSE